MPKDSTASYTTAYEVYRNGKLIATTTDTRYTDHDYITGARYEVRTVRTYKGFSGRNSAKAAATRTGMKAPERVIGVNYTAQEQKQSEYLNKLYGGNYTFSNTAKAPVDDRALNMSLLGRNKLCAYGWEPINFNTGHFLLETVDGAWADLGLAELTVDRTYNAQSDAADGPFGAHWSTTWTEHLRLYTEGDVVYVAADGAEIIFTMDANGVYTGGESRGLTLTTGDDGREYWITDLDGVTHAFTGMGLLSGIQWPDGNRITVRRDEDGLITGFLLPSGETLNVESDKSGHITTIATLGGSIKYTAQLSLYGCSGLIYKPFFCPIPQDNKHISRRTSCAVKIVLLIVSAFLPFCAGNFPLKFRDKIERLLNKADGILAAYRITEQNIEACAASHRANIDNAVLICTVSSVSGK